MFRTDTGYWQELVTRYGSPLYVYDLECVDGQINRLRDALPDGAGIYYSLKANPLPSLVRRVVKRGCRLEITSPNELQVACASGLAPANILYGGPGKSLEEIEAALVAGVGLFSVESWTDLRRLHTCARETGRNVKVLLRLNPSEAVASGLAMSGAATQFGFCEEELQEAEGAWEQYADNIKVAGFHIYYGTQMASPEKIAESVLYAVRSVERLCSAWGLKPEILDLGGGFPWPYGRDEEGPGLAGLREQLVEVLAERRLSAGASVWFESGRFLSASSGTLLTRVLDVKGAGSDHRFVILDSGINHLGGMSGLGRIPRSRFQFLRVTDDLRYEAAMQPANMVGPLCSPLDCLARQVMVPADLKPGDLLAIPNVGAYGLTASLIGFLSRPAPWELACYRGSVVAAHQWRHGHESFENISEINPLKEEMV